MAKTKKAKDDLHIRGKRRCNLALEACGEMESLFNALIEQGRVLDDLDDSTVKALAARGVTLTQAAITALGDDSAAAADSIEDWERKVSHGD